tara:strand:+ start:17716 stop:19242 length:1527 start_codon:yes stop_codon:yes gene_type:complete
MPFEKINLGDQTSQPMVITKIYEDHLVVKMTGFDSTKASTIVYDEETRQPKEEVPLAELENVNVSKPCGLRALDVDKQGDFEMVDGEKGIKRAKSDNFDFAGTILNKHDKVYITPPYKVGETIYVTKIIANEMEPKTSSNPFFKVSDETKTTTAVAEPEFRGQPQRAASRIRPDESVTFENKEFIEFLDKKQGDVIEIPIKRTTYIVNSPFGEKLRNEERKVTYRLVQIDENYKFYNPKTGGGTSAGGNLDGRGFIPDGDFTVEPTFGDYPKILTFPAEEDAISQEEKIKVKILTNKSGYFLLEILNVDGITDIKQKGIVVFVNESGDKDVARGSQRPEDVGSSERGTVDIFVDENREGRSWALPGAEGMSKKCIVLCENGVEVSGEILWNEGCGTSTVTTTTSTGEEYCIECSSPGLTYENAVDGPVGEVRKWYITKNYKAADNPSEARQACQAYADDNDIIGTGGDIDAVDVDSTFCGGQSTTQSTSAPATAPQALNINVAEVERV